MDKGREELSLPSYMQVKGANQSSSALRARKRAQPVGKALARQAAPEQITLDEFAASASPKHKANRPGATRQSASQAKRARPASRISQSASANALTRMSPKTAQGELRSGPAPVKMGGQKSASSQRAAGNAIRSANAATAKRPARARRAASGLDMTSSRIANQPRRVEEKQQRKKGAGIHIGRLLLVLLVLSGLFAGIYALAKSLPSAAGAAGDSIDVGATAKLPKGVSILGIDVGGQTKSAARGAVLEAAETALAKAQVTLKLGEESYVIKGSDMALSYDIEAVLDKALAYDPDEADKAGVVDVTGGASAAPGEFNNIFTCDAAALRQAVEEIAAQFDIEPVNAIGKPAMNADHTVSFEYQEGKTGRALDVDATVQKIEDMLARGIYTAQIEGIYGSVEPAVTGAMLTQEMGMRGSFTTKYATIGRVSADTPTIENRVFNIHKAADIINGCLVAPDEEWSFNTFVGPRTLATGWKEAKGIADGKEYTMQAGGGICQVSTTLYNALRQSKVTVTDRRAHSIPSDYVDHGLDATVDYAMDLDLKFINDTGAPLYLFAYFEDDPNGRHMEYITFVIYGKPLENGVSYKMRSVIADQKQRTDVKYTQDETIPRGYKVVTIESRPSYMAEVYLDKYVGEGLVDSEYLYTDKYAGNAEEAKLGTGSPKYHAVPHGAVAVD